MLFGKKVEGWNSSPRAINRHYPICLQKAPVLYFARVLSSSCLDSATDALNKHVELNTSKRKHSVFVCLLPESVVGLAPPSFSFAELRPPFMQFL